MKGSKPRGEPKTIDCLCVLGAHYDELYFTDRLFQKIRTNFWDEYTSRLLNNDGTMDPSNASSVVKVIQRVLNEKDERLTKGASLLILRLFPTITKLSFRVPSWESPKTIEICISLMNPNDLPRVLRENEKYVSRSDLINGVLKNQQLSEIQKVGSGDAAELGPVRSFIDGLIFDIIGSLRPGRSTCCMFEWLMWVLTQTLVPRTRVLEICAQLFKTPDAMLAVAVDLACWCVPGPYSGTPLQILKVFVAQLACLPMYGISGVDLAEAQFEFPEIDFCWVQDTAVPIQCPKFKLRIDSYIESVEALLAGHLVIGPVATMTTSYLRSQLKIQD